MEELGIKVEPREKVWECLTDDKEYLLHWWHSSLEDDTVTVNPDEAKEYRWLTFAEMLGLDKMFDADRKFFRKIAPRLQDS
jgi:8-oxo-dGTP pyrophosphatase MutT (NUDIX family)